MRKIPARKELVRLPDPNVTTPSSIAVLLGSFRQFNKQLRHLLQLQADALGATPVQMLVLQVLSEFPDISLSELADRLQLGCSTISGVVKRLGEAGLIERERLAEDQRTVTLRLSDKGRMVEDNAFGEDSILRRSLEKLLTIPDADMAHLLETHRKMIEVLQAEGEKIES